MIENEKTCPRCLSARLKNWKELSGDEKFTAERLPASAGFSKKERENHLFCTRCWFETKPTTIKV